MAKYKVLSTKRLKPSLVEEANQKDIEIIEKEFISIHPIYSDEKKSEISDSFEVTDIVITSSNAVEVLQKYLEQLDRHQEWNIYCISGKTKESIEASKNIKGQIIATADSGAELANKIISNGCREVVFFCGDKRRDELPELLSRAGIKLREVALYNTVETPIKVSEEFDGILFFSPSAVSSFFSINELNKDAVCFAIGNTTADAIKSCSTNKCIISKLPAQEAMMSAVELYFQNINCIK